MLKDKLKKKNKDKKNPTQVRMPYSQLCHESRITIYKRD
jgi:hypothetical protein